ncbi:hypothetical protein GGI35DRAFT_408787 [Trichoderma velutinum]
MKTPPKSHCHHPFFFPASFFPHGRLVLKLSFPHLSRCTDTLSLPGFPLAPRRQLGSWYLPSPERGRKFCDLISCLGAFLDLSADFNLPFYKFLPKKRLLFYRPPERHHALRLICPVLPPLF